MALILGIETSTDICSVALLCDGDVVALRESAGGEHARLLAVYIDQVLRDAGMVAGNLDAVAVSAGPGSYTGLRIGVSTAKGLCYGLGVPLIAVDSLEALACQVVGKYGDGTVLCPMIDARRMEVYTRLFDNRARAVGAVEAMVVDENSFSEYRNRGVSPNDNNVPEGTFVIFGSGAAKCVSALPWAQYLEVEASARGLARTAREAYAARRFEDVAYYQPLYLKDFVATQSRKKLF